MRRTLIACAVAVVVVVAFAFGQARSGLTPAVQAPLQSRVAVEKLAARGLTFGPDGQMYFTTTSSQDRVFALASALASPSLVAGTGVTGSLGDGGAAASAQLDLTADSLGERSGIAVGVDGALYIADTQNGTIRRVAGPDGAEPGIIRSLAGRWGPRQNASLLQPLGIALDRAGNLYIADHQTGALDVLKASDGSLQTIAQVASPASVAVTEDGSVAFVASPEIGIVVAVDLRTGSVKNIAGNAAAAAPSSTPDAPACGPASSEPPRFCPSGLAVDHAGNLYISDAGSGTVIRVDTADGAKTVILRNIQKPGDLAFQSGTGDLYIAEQGLSRIVELQGAGGNSGPLTLSPASFTFPNEPISGVSQATQFTLTNTSNAAVSNIQVTSPGAPSAQGDFSLESTSCGTTLGANASCNINVSFTPVAVGQRNSSVSVTDSAGDSASASLSGLADDYQLQLASGQLPEVSIRQGDAATFHLQAVATGAFGQSGEQVSFLCPGNVPAQSTCTVNPTSASPMAGSPVNFTVTIQTSSSTSQAQVFAPAPTDWPRTLFPALLFLSFCAVALFVPASSFGRAWRIALVSACFVLLGGCRHKKFATATATPAGPAAVQVQGAALSSNGTPLGASRSLTITVDVVQ